MAKQITVEWATLGLWGFCVTLLGVSLFLLAPVSLWVSLPVLIVALVLHASLTHEVIHGHPFASRAASQALVWINLGLLIPFLRFRDTHLAHHMDSRLTDPYEDPETNYLDPAVWASLSRWQQTLRRANNTLAGRMLLGPALGMWDFVRQDLALVLSGDYEVRRAWLHHAPGVGLVIALVWASPMSVWWYLFAVYAAMSVLKVRTFLEHQAHELARGRTVIVEARCLLAFLFLFNSLHVVHHMHPRVPWYRLPRLYEANKDHYQRRNDGYVFASYAAVFKAYLFQAKDPVAHPLWSSKP